MIQHIIHSGAHQAPFTEELPSNNEEPKGRCGRIILTAPEKSDQLARRVMVIQKKKLKMRRSSSSVPVRDAKLGPSVVLICFTGAIVLLSPPGFWSRCL